MNTIKVGLVGIATSTEPAFTSADFETLLAQSDPDQDTILDMHSEGGSVLEGFRMGNFVGEFAGRTIARVNVAAFSIASYIAVRCDEIEITPNGFIMIHNPKAELEGDDEELATSSKLLSQMKTSMIDAYVSKTGLDAETIQTMMKEETWLSADEAVKLGFADRIVSVEQPTPPKFTNTLPALVRAMFRGQDEQQGDDKGEEGEGTGAAVRKELRRLQDSGWTLKSIGERVNRDEGTLSSILNEEIKNPPTDLLDALKKLTSKESAMTATVKSIKIAFPKAKADFIVKCMEEEMTDDQVKEARAKAMEEENEELKAKLSAMDEELTALKAKAMDEDEEAKAMEEDEHAKAMEDEKETAKARGGVKPVARRTVSTGSAKVQWNELVDKYVAKGKPRIQAVRLANKERPELREALVEQAN